MDSNQFIAAGRVVAIFILGGGLGWLSGKIFESENVAYGTGIAVAIFAAVFVFATPELTR